MMIQLTKKITLKNTLLLCGIFLFYFNLSAQNHLKIHKKYSIEELKEDFSVYRNKLEKNLANLYLYNTKEQMDHVFDSLYQGIRNPMTDMEFYAYLTQLMSIIKDGHNYIYPDPQTTHYYNQNARFFPFHVVWMDDKLMIDKRCTPDSIIEIGSEILEINGLKSGFIMQELLRRQVRDGYNETYPLWILNHYFREFYSYVFGHPDSFRIRYKSKEGKEDEVIVNGLTKEKMICYLGNPLYPEVKKEKGIVYTNYQAENVAYLQVKSFDRNYYFKYYRQNYNRNLRKAFREIKQSNTPNLILDLRGNQGGNFEYGERLLSYLLKEPFQLIERTNAMYCNHDSTRLKKSLCYATKWTKPKKNMYTGNLYVLMDGGCFSNCGIVVSDLAYHKRAVFIGEETGGNKALLSGAIGFEKITILPNTKIHCDPVNHQIVVNSQLINDGHGTLPNYLIKPTLFDLFHGIDPVKQFAVDLIKK